MDMNAIREKLRNLSQQTGKRKDIWKPKDKHEIRLVPYPHGGDPIVELWFHYDIGNTKQVLCPKHNYSDECVICDFADKLKSWNDENGNEKPEKVRKADFEIFRKVQPKESWFVAMVERGEESLGPKFWRLNRTVYGKILEMCVDDELMQESCQDGSGVLFDTGKAFDLKIDLKKAGGKDGKGNNKQFDVTEVGHKMKTSPLAPSKKEIEEILKNVSKIGDVYTKVTSAEVEKIFNDFVSSGGAAVDEGSKKNGKEYAANSAEKPVQGGQSLDDAFGELVAEDN